MNDSAILSTTSSLKNIVTIVAGLAITNAVVGLFVVNNVAQFSDLDLQTILVFFLFIMNILRFHHGNIRHIDTTYSAKRGKASVTHRLVGAAGKTALDFFVIFFQSIIFALLSFLLRKYDQFFIIFTVLIAIDVIWYLGVHGMVTDRSSFLHQKKWTINNVVTLIALLLIVSNTDRIGDNTAFYICFSIILINTIVDYWISWSFYFPSLENECSDGDVAE